MSQESRLYIYIYQEVRGEEGGVGWCEGKGPTTICQKKTPFCFRFYSIQKPSKRVETQEKLKTYLGGSKDTLSCLVQFWRD